MKPNSVRAGLCLVLIVVTIHHAFAGGTTGILKGKITDIRSGESLPLVNVLILGSGRGAVTNDKGEYQVVGITPGSYAVRVSLLGYQILEAKKVMINADETTVMNFKLASTEIEMEGVTVEGTRPLVDVTKTAGDQTYSKEKIESLPNVKGYEDVLALQAGVVKFGSKFFLRGGRANETQILVDGVPVNDVGGVTGTAGTSTANEQLQQIYSGSATGSALSVSAKAIQSVSVSSSGLDAEFGNAQSGVVNITTKGGGDDYDGSVHYRTDEIASSGFNSHYYAGDIGGPEPITRYLLPALGVEVPGKLAFFMSSTFDQSDGPYHFNTSQFYSPLKRKIRFTGLFGDILNNLGFTYSDRQNNTYSFNTKISYVVGESDQFFFRYSADASSTHPLSAGYNWRDFSDSTASTVRMKTQNMLSWTHILGTNALLKAYVSRQEREATSSVGGLSPDLYSIVTELSALDPNGNGFNDLGTGQSWSTSNEVIWNSKVDYSAQVHEYHFLKAGAEYYYEHVQSTAISFPLNARRDTSQRGAYPGYGYARWVSNNMPSRGALYVQDNIELTGINVHVGLRYDFYYLGDQVFSSDFVSRWEAATREKADWADSLRNRSFWSQFIRGKISPRLSIGYPISSRTVFYFNYAHFLQYPDRNQYYQDPISDKKIDGNYVGNPALRPMKTVQYEAGFDQLLFEDLSLGIRGYYKDTFDDITTQPVIGSPYDISKFVNLDYASARGFEVIISKQERDHIQGSLGYTFQLAKGRTSDPLAAAASPELNGLPREVRLDFDQQHTLNLFVSYRVGPREEYTVFGLPFNYWGVSLTWTYGSGFPYTPYNRGRTLQDVYLKNTGNGPYTSDVGVSVHKGFRLMEKLSLVFTLDITNLLNRSNVDINGGGFNNATGAPYIFGDYDPNDPKDVYAWNSFDARVSPYTFSPPRQILLGMKINWE